MISKGRYFRETVYYPYDRCRWCSSPCSEEAVNQRLALAENDDDKHALQALHLIAVGAQERDAIYHREE